MLYVTLQQYLLYYIYNVPNRQELIGGFSAQLHSRFEFSVNQFIHTEVSEGLKSAVWTSGLYFHVKQAALYKTIHLLHSVSRTSQHIPVDLPSNLIITKSWLDKTETLKMLWDYLIIIHLNVDQGKCCCGSIRLGFRGGQIKWRGSLHFSLQLWLWIYCISIR